MEVSKMLVEKFYHFLSVGLIAVGLLLASFIVTVALHIIRGDVNGL